MDETGTQVDAPKLDRRVLDAIGSELRSTFEAGDTLPAGDELFELVERTKFLERFWTIFGGNPSRWGGPPTGEELDLPSNHLDQRLLFASCSFDPIGKHCRTGQRKKISCAFVARVLHRNLENLEMWKLLSECLRGQDFVIVVALINHRFQEHFH